MDTNGMPVLFFTGEGPLHSVRLGGTVFRVIFVRDCGFYKLIFFFRSVFLATIKVSIYELRSFIQRRIR